MRLPRLAWIAISLLGCGSPTESPATTAATPVAPVAVPAEPSTSTTVDTVAAPIDPAHLFDPNGDSRVIEERVVDGRRYALLLRDEMLRGYRGVSDERGAAYGDLLFDCLESNDFRCAAAIAPNVGVMAGENLSDHVSSWHVAIFEGDRLVAQRSVFAATVHDPARPHEPSRLEVRDIDGDGNVEVMVQVPVSPLTDDMMLRDRIREEGEVTYILDGRELSIEARWTSGFYQVWPDDETGEGGETSCDRDYVEMDGSALTILELCTDTAERDVRCTYSRDADQYSCPRHFGEELLGPNPAELHFRHYVAQDEAGLERLLGAFGTRDADVRERMAGIAAENALEPVSPNAANPSAANPSAVSATAEPAVAPSAAPSTALSTSAAGTHCRRVVDDPAPPLHVRAEPSSRSEIVGDLPNGTALEFTSERGRWARIAAPVEGWVWTQNIRSVCE